MWSLRNWCPHPTRGPSGPSHSRCAFGVCRDDGAGCGLWIAGLRIGVVTVKIGISINEVGCDSHCLDASQ